MRAIGNSFIALAAACSPMNVHAATTADGVVLINQAAANAGNVTAGDTAGFPITLSVSGSYRLSSDLLVPAGKNGISVTARGVTIDFNGFTMRGGSAAANGVFANVGALTVKNGGIQNFTGDGVFVFGPEARVENMRLFKNGGYGINELYVNASPKTGLEDGKAILKNNIITQNTQGITCQAACHIEGNVISDNVYSGIIVSQSGATVINNTIMNNGGNGVVGNYIGLGGNTIFGNQYCHTSGVMIVMEKNAIYPTSSGSYCAALPGN